METSVKRTRPRHHRLDELDRILLEERKRIAAEVHDTLAQGFTGIIVQLAAARRDPGVIRNPHVMEAERLARASLEDARGFMGRLWLYASEGSNLVHALQHLVAEKDYISGARVRLSVKGRPHPIPPEVGLNLLRIAQEALANALRHGSARGVSLDLRYSRSFLRLEIRDDGVGFDPGAAARGGYGLAIMRNRAARIGGELTVAAGAGKGTVILARVPSGGLGIGKVERRNGR